jgi:hypothetical protein
VNHRAFIAALLTAGCTDPATVDGQYRVAVEETENTCNDVPLDTSTPGLTTRLDLFRRSDGLYDLHWLDGWIPDAYALTGIDPGNVTDRSIDLELVARGAACERRLSVHGVKRPMFDPDTVDGRYIITIDNRGATCADGTTIAATGPWNMRMEVLPFRDDRTSVVIEDLHGGMLRFWIEPIGVDGSIQLTHDVFFAAGADSLTSLDGTVTGTIVPDSVELAAQIFGKDDPKRCVTSYAITGHRWLPSADSPDAEFRTRYRATDSCDPTYEDVHEDVGFAVAQADAEIDLIDRDVQSTVGFDGLHLGAPLGSSLTYLGTLTPSRASYVVEDHYTFGGQACVASLEVDGSARYR